MAASSARLDPPHVLDAVGVVFISQRATDSYLAAAHMGDTNTPPISPSLSPVTPTPWGYGGGDGNCCYITEITHNNILLYGVCVIQNAI